MRLATLLLMLFSMRGCSVNKEYQLPDRPMRRDGTMLCVAEFHTCNPSSEPIAGRPECFPAAIQSVQENLPF